MLISKGETGAGSEWVTTHPMSDASQNVVLLPVSTVGGSNVDALSFVYDTKWSPDATDGKNYATEFDDAANYQVNSQTVARYMTEKFQIKAEQACDLYLDSLTKFTATDSEMSKVMRLGLVVSDGTTKNVFIYQTDSSEDASGTRGNTTKDSTGADGISTAVNASGNVASITVNNKTGNAGALVLADAAQDTSSMITNVGNADKLYSFEHAGDIVTITAYVWMEGCDYDCTASESAYFDKSTDGTGKVTASLSFGAALPPTGP